MQRDYTDRLLEIVLFPSKHKLQFLIFLAKYLFDIYLSISIFQGGLIRK